MHELALELNAVLDKSPAGPFLSSLGRRLFFPRGIIAQAMEAKKTGLNATLGMAFNKGKPLILSPLLKNLPGLKPEEAVIYAPTAGIEAFRQVWKTALINKNPSLKGTYFSLPIVVPGITAGISYIADLFLDSDDEILAANPSWDNYSLIFEERRGAVLKTIPLFTEQGGLNTRAFEKAIKEQAAKGLVRIILNFPHNPSGYTPLVTEANTLLGVIKEAADKGASVLVICDDAYFGLFYEEEIIKESLFARLVNLHEKVLAVKIDGPTKEDYVWGFRTAFITFGSKSLDENTAAALEKKCMGAIRSSVSCANTPAQYLTLKSWEDPETWPEKEAFYSLLYSRYRAVKQFLAENPVPSSLQALPFNSGYFMSFRCSVQQSCTVQPCCTSGNKPSGAEKIRQAMLAKGIGTIAWGDEYLRVTFAAIEEKDIPRLYRAIYEAAEN